MITLSYYCSSLLLDDNVGFPVFSFFEFLPRPPPVGKELRKLAKHVFVVLTFVRAEPLAKLLTKTLLVLGTVFLVKPSFLTQPIHR